jgi:prevent-host-death family protein
MLIVSSSEARNNLAAMLDKAQHEPIAIQKQGRKAAVLVSYENTRANQCFGCCISGSIVKPSVRRRRPRIDGRKTSGDSGRK